MTYLFHLLIFFIPPLSLTHFLQTEADRNLLVFLLNEYAKDPFGGGEELPATTMATLGETLRDFPTSHGT